MVLTNVILHTSLAHLWLLERQGLYVDLAELATEEGQVLQFVRKPTLQESCLGISSSNLLQSVSVLLTEVDLREARCSIALLYMESPVNIGKGSLRALKDIATPVEILDALRSTIVAHGIA